MWAEGQDLVGPNDLTRVCHRFIGHCGLLGSGTSLFLVGYIVLASHMLTSGVGPESATTGLVLLGFEVVEDRLTATGRLDDGNQTRQLGFKAPTLLRCDEELFE